MRQAGEVGAAEKGIIMADENIANETQATPKSRRDFVTASAEVAVTAPAVALLLNALTKQASAQIALYEASITYVLDDFTIGSSHEDIDALQLGSNFNPINNGISRMIMSSGMLK